MDSRRLCEEIQHLGKIGIWENDLVNNRLEWSDELYRIFGYEPFEKSAREIFDRHLHPDDKDIYWKQLGKTLSSNESFIPTCEFRIIRKDNQVCYCQARGIFVTDEQNKKIGIYGIIQDITENKHVELNLKEQNIQKNKFLTLIAHDLRNPFNTLLGYSELLKESIKSLDYTLAEKYTKIIHNTTEQTLNFLLNLLDWARSQSGLMVFKPVFFSAIHLINDVVQLLSYSIAAKNIHVTVHVNPDLKAFADKNMVQTVLLNLISNSVKYSNPGGIILVKAHLVKNVIEFSVTDNGIGILSEDLDKLFRIGQQFSTSGTNHEKGTGLGLIICKEFVDKHQGKIWAESTYGKGSTFYFTISQTDHLS
jgi:PAS domain S-box-containing protein